MVHTNFLQQSAQDKNKASKINSTNVKIESSSYNNKGLNHPPASQNRKRQVTKTCMKVTKYCQQRKTRDSY